MEQGYDVKEISKTIRQELKKAKTIRQELKKAHPECKFSVRIERSSAGAGISVNLMSGPFLPFILEGKMRGQVYQCQLSAGYEAYVARFGPLTEEAFNVLASAVEIGNREHWNNSFAVGKWNKKYEVTK